MRLCLCLRGLCLCLCGRGTVMPMEKHPPGLEGGVVSCPCCGMSHQMVEERK